jgi:serine phosphatase RsbU (regulator of sigma subunit)
VKKISAHPVSVPAGLAVLHDLLVSLPAAVALLAGPDLRVVCANDPLRRLLRERAVEGRPLWEVVPELAPPDQAATPVRAMLAGEAGRASGIRVDVSRQPGGPAELILDFAWQPMRGPGQAMAGIVLSATDITAQARAQRRADMLTRQLARAKDRYRALLAARLRERQAREERADLERRERAARAQAEYAGERLAFLVRAGAMVAATRNRHELLEHAAALVVPALADHCLVFLPTAEGKLRATSLAHRDPARAPALAEFQRYEIPPAGPMSTQTAYSTGTSQLMQQAETRATRWQGLPARLLNSLIMLRANSVLATPLLVNGHPAGVLTLARDAQRPPFTAADVEVAEEFARRLADGIATADRFAREHTIAETLQRSLLPGALPEVAGVDLSACFMPASDTVHVGGDWYDAFPLGQSRIGLIIGDVSGHNITSAAVMGQVRSLLRAYALDYPGPAEVLSRTSDALTRVLPDALASAVYAVLDVTTGELSYANAGHPPPLVTTRAGNCGYLSEEPGTMLGAAPGLRYRSHSLRLDAGCGLLLYTDGLIESRTRDISDGLDALASALRGVTARTAAQICGAAESILRSSPIRADDVCLLAALLQPA